MSIAYLAQEALANAHRLADMGMPIFAARLSADGNPDRLDRRWQGWEKKGAGRSSHAAIDTWHPGEALCGVTGVVFDVIDYDPRNDPSGHSPRLLDKALGDNGPEVYMRVSTPSGGYHLYIAKLGIAKTKLAGFPGVDIQAGRPDGTGRGFVFMPPTERISKVTGEVAPYRLRVQASAVNGDSGSAALRELAVRRIAEGTGTREEPDTLRKAAQEAEAGDQRNTLLRYVHELERRGYKPDDIVRLCVSLKLENFDPKRPWKSADFRGLLHRPGEVIPDAEPGELDGIGGPLRRGLVKAMVEAPDEIMEWIWEEYLAVGEMTLLDGEKGQGKTFSIYDVIARGSRGRPMPGKEEAIVEPFSSIIFTYEGVGAIKPRLQASGADLKRVFVPVLERKKRGDRYSSDPLALPEGAENIGRMIRESGARLALFDPIADFLDRDTQSHNDASVRIALRPLGEQLRATRSAGLAIRHMNKDKSADARFRGTGTSAFQNRARVHLICGEMQDRGADGERRFAIGMADSNDTRRIGGALAYSVVDSEIPLDDHGRFVGRVNWEGYVDVDVNQLSRGPQINPRPGPRGLAQELAEEVINELFAHSKGFPVPAKDVTDALKASGCSTSPSVLAKVRSTLGIRTVQQRIKGKQGEQVAAWVWVMD